MSRDSLRALPVSPANSTKDATGIRKSGRESLSARRTEP
jgi:hypothetical protein